jgi:peptidoglycan/xylan/chitin deacetylase (PgdA/CDA1 family)
VAVTTGSVSTDQQDWVRAGGALVVDSALGGDGVVPVCARRVTVSGFEDPHGRRVTMPGPVAVYPGDGDGLVRVHEDRVVKHGLEQGRYALVHRVRVGRGQVVFTGARLTEALASHGDRLREVADWSPVTERIASVDKAGVSETLAWMVAEAAGLVGLPVVRRTAWPGGAQSVFVLRVDVDGVYGDRARRIGDVAGGLGVRATFFLNRELSEAHPGDLGRWLDAHDVGQHGDTHDLFDEPLADRQNLTAGEDWVRSTTGRDPVGFVAPRGLWSPSLDEAIAALGYRWSSDFGLATDGRPFWPVGPVLQLPVHAYSPERAVRWAAEQGRPPPSAAEIRDHYLRHLEEQVGRGRPVHVYGHPEVLGAVAEQVLPPLVARARALGLPILTLDELARHWEARRRASVAARVTDDDGQPALSLRRTDPKTAVEVLLPRPMAVSVDGEPRGVLSGQAVLR